MHSSLAVLTTMPWRHDSQWENTGFSRESVTQGHLAKGDRNGIPSEAM